MATVRLRAEHVLMAVVVALGVYAVSRMGSASGGSSPPKVPEKGDDPGLPPIPNDAGRGPLRKDQAYLGRLDLAGSATTADVETLLQGLGFGEITIYPDIGSAAAFVPPLPYVLDAPGSGTRWFRAVAGRTGLIARPPAMTYLWATAT